MRGPRWAAWVRRLADGIARQKLADPNAVPDELGTLLSLLFSAATRPADEGHRARS
jgi:hypothetical protein